MRLESRKKFSAQLEFLHEMLEFIQNEAGHRLFSEDACSRIILAVEEALVNVIRYSYKEGKGQVELVCRDAKEREGIEIVIKDQGIPFNPLEKVDKDHKKKELLNLSIDEASIGGYGIYIFLGIMDRVLYAHEDGHNVLTLIKYKEL